MMLDVEGARSLLRRTPSVVDSLLGGLPETWVHENEGPDTWSSFDVVGHLLEAEETNWIPRIRHLIEHGESAVFPPFDRFGFIEKSKGKNMAEMLDAFASARARTSGPWTSSDSRQRTSPDEVGTPTSVPSRSANSSPHGRSTT